MNPGTTLSNIIEKLQKNGQMTDGIENVHGTEYQVKSFSTVIDDNTYIIKDYRETGPNWKDSGPMGDYLNTLTVIDKDQNKIVELSATLGSNSSYIFSPNNDANLSLINFDKLSDKVNEQILSQASIPKVEQVMDNMQKIRDKLLPSTKQTASQFYDWR